MNSLKSRLSTVPPLVILPSNLFEGGKASPVWLRLPISKVAFLPMDVYLRKGPLHADCPLFFHHVFYCMRNDSILQLAWLDSICCALQLKRPMPELTGAPRMAFKLRFNEAP